MAITVNEFKNAFREVVSEEFSHIPTDENSIDFTFSEKFERQMERLIRSQRKIFYSFVNSAYKRVATVLVVLLTTAVTLFSIKPVRDGAFNFLDGIYNSLNQNSFEDNPSSNPSGNEKEVKYRLIYAKKYMIGDTNLSPGYHNDDNLVDSYLKEIVSKFEGQDVYFRVKVTPVVFYEETQEEGYTKEKGEELKKQRIEYVKKFGARDMVLVPNTSYTYYASLNAEMIKKIDKKGGCQLHLVTLPRADGYNDKINDVLVYSLENMKDDQTVDVKFSAEYRYGSETLDKIFAKADVLEQQITAKEYYQWQTEDYYDGIVTIERVLIEGSLTKQQILVLAAEESIGNFSLIKEDNIAIVDVTENMKTP